MRFGALALALVAATPAAGDESRWSVNVEAVQLDLSGHDPVVLIDRALGGGPTPAATDTELALETDEALGYRAELRYVPGRWSYGLDLLLHRTDQIAAPRTGAASGSVAQRVFVVGGSGQVVSDDPGERLYFQRLEDTTVELWTLDLFAARELLTGPKGELRLVLGVRAADFDNDYHAVTGLEEIGGVRLDASSNYDRMHGPLVGLEGHLELGRSRFDAYIGQSIVWGDTELSSQSRQFVGPPSFEVENVPNVVGQERFTTVENVSIPITELRLDWRFRITDHLAVGAGAFFSSWWDVAVPPGVVAGTSLETLAESTIEMFGLSAGVTVAF